MSEALIVNLQHDSGLELLSQRLDRQAQSLGYENFAALSSSSDLGPEAAACLSQGFLEKTLIYQSTFASLNELI